GHQHSENTRPACARNVHCFERGVIADVVRRFAVRDLPDNLALVEIDRSNAAVRRFCEWKPLNIEAAAAALGRNRGGWSSCRTWRGLWRLSGGIGRRPRRSRDVPHVRAGPIRGYESDATHGSL